MKRLLFASGGSGGHLAPAIALAQLSRRLAPCHTWIATTQKRVDQRMQRRYPDHAFISLDSSPLTGALRSRLAALGRTGKGMFQAFHGFHRHRFDLVVATGGFGCVPVLIAAIVLGVPFVLHESNGIPGRVTRRFASAARWIFVTRLMDAVHQRRLPRTRLTGFPIRQDLRLSEKACAKRALGFDANRALIGFLGGSQGASALTQAARDWVSQGLPEPLQAICIVGPHSDVEDGVAGPSRAQADRVRWVSFVEDMGTFLSAVDVLVARAGAGSIAEIASAGCPSILVPLPSAADDHQRANARRFEAHGCAAVCEQSQLSGLPDRVLQLLGDAESLAAMRKAMQDWVAQESVHAMVAGWMNERERVI